VKEKRSYIIAAVFLGLIGLLVLFCSCLSFDIADWPSSFVYPHNNPANNLCGSIGAFFAYYMLYFIGPGVFMAIISAICLLTAIMMNKHITQISFRIIGLSLLTVAASATFYCFWPESVYKFPIGSGGALGLGTSMFLRSHFGLFGTFLLITAVWIVGFILLADRLVLAAAAGLGLTLTKIPNLVSPAIAAARENTMALNEIWKKLSEKQKAIQENREDLRRHGDEHIEEHLVETESAEEPQIQESTAEPKPFRVTSQVAPKPQKAYVPPSYEDYTLPPLELLAEPEYSFSAVQGKVVKSKAAALEKLLFEFNINAKVVAADTGPVVTMFELELAAGIKVSQISALANDMARALSAGAVRVVAPIPGKHTIGIEVPNSEKEKVRMKDMLQLAGHKHHRMKIPLFLGKDSAGEALVSDLSTMPHMLIAGTTGSGKSVCINTIIASILITKRPDEVKLILVDPKMVEMTAFNTVPHLMTPIVTETKRAVQILEWATVKMDERYSLLAEAKVKNITGYNQLSSEEIIERFNPSTPDEEAKIPKKLSYIVIVIDELADLMMTAAKDIEAYIVRLAQKSRAVGIHLVLATQRPQATVVTGLIKSNMPTRIGFRVAARMDSRIILDQNGAEALLGQGDMLFLKPGTSDLIRAQGTFLDEAEVKRIVKHLKDVAEPQFHPELAQLGRVNTADMPKDDLFEEAVRMVIETKRGSVSLLQRRLSIGYARASRIIEMMAAAGVIGEYKGSQAREVLMDIQEFEKFREQTATEPDDEDESSDSDHTQDNYDDEPSYINAGQKEYVAIDTEEE
jgi:S-DNA-T family DNA segregation ATPase FtsK/SpoIIIE